MPIGVMSSYFFHFKRKKMVGFHPAFSRHVRAEAKHLAKKKKLDSPGKETPTLSYYLCSLWGTLLRYPIEITMRIMMWESYTGCI